MNKTPAKLMSTSRLPLLLVMVGLLPLSACSWFGGDDGMFRNRGGDYLRAESLPPLKLPEGVEQRPNEPLYRVPARVPAEMLPVSDDVPRPQPLSSSKLEDKVKIQKLGETRWILVNNSPSEAWPRVRHFLNSSKISVAYTDVNLGIIETSWLRFRDDEVFKDKYRIRIESGVQPDTAEIHVLHLSVSKDLPASVEIDWPEASVNPEREAWLLDDLAASLVDANSGEAASLLAQSIGTGEKVELINRMGESVITMALDFDRAWASVSFALTKEGFSVDDRDRSAGTFFVTFQPDDSESSWLSGWLGFGDDEVQPKQYRVQVDKVDGGVEVRLLTDKQKPVARDEGKRLMTLIRGNLA